MNKERLRRYSWAIYMVIALVAAVMMLGSRNLNAEGLQRQVLIGIATNLLAVSAVFFIVQQLFLYTPEKDKEEQLNLQINRFGELLEEYKSTRSDVQLFPTRGAVFEAGILALQKYQWYRLRIFAPVGLWERRKIKQDWLDSVSEHASNKDVKSVWGVYGLPPTSKRGVSRSQQEVIDDLVRARLLLDPLDGLSNVELHFYPPVPASVGIGMLIFENLDQADGELAIALASQGDEATIDSGFSIDHREAFLLAKQWFDDQIFLKATGKFVLQEQDSPLSDRWETIIENWYGESYLPVWKKAWAEAKTDRSYDDRAVGDLRQ